VGAELMLLEWNERASPRAAAADNKFKNFFNFGLYYPALFKFKATHG